MEIKNVMVEIQPIASMINSRSLIHNFPRLAPVYLPEATMNVPWITPHIEAPRREYLRDM